MKVTFRMKSTLWTIRPHLATCVIPPGWRQGLPDRRETQHCRVRFSIVGPGTVNAGIPVAIVALFVVWFALCIGGFGVWLWALIDAARRPDWAYAASYSSKTMWIVLIAVLGFIPAIIYLLAIRPKVQAAEGAFTAQVPSGPFADGYHSAPAFCTRCGSPLASDARFCWRCGQSR